MLTGDAVAIGKELAKQLRLGTNIYDSERLIGGTMAGSDVRASLVELFYEVLFSAHVIGTRFR